MHRSREIIVWQILSYLVDNPGTCSASHILKDCRISGAQWNEIAYGLLINGLIHAVTVEPYKYPRYDVTELGAMAAKKARKLMEMMA